MVIDSFKSVKHASVYEGIIVILALLAGTGIFSEYITSVVASLCFGGVFICYGARSVYIDCQDDKHQIMCIKRYLIPFFVVSLMICVCEAIKMVFMANESSGLIDALSDTTTFWGYGPVGLIAALYIGILLYDVLRSKLGFREVLIAVVVIFAIIQFLYSRYFSFAVIKTGTAYYLYKLVMVFIYRGLISLIFIGLGETLERLLIKEDLASKQIHRFVWAILGGLLTICGFLAFGYNKDINLTYMQLGNGYIFVISVALLALGIYLICRWVGEGAILEYMGHRFVILYAAGDCLFGSYLSRVVSMKVFDYTNHNFVRNFSAVVTMSVVVAAAVLLYKFYSKIRRAK